MFVEENCMDRAKDYKFEACLTFRELLMSSRYLLAYVEDAQAWDSAGPG